MTTYHNICEDWGDAIGGLTVPITRHRLKFSQLEGPLCRLRPMLTMYTLTAPSWPMQRST